ncbi:adenylate/guanylate cyclase domain-containing protein [Labrenzia suaedae]|uniref:Adenylate/guanylate cyclase domain-containing protein n=1 Tax=Roseibium litorale TaxID=2803841 RepID=A0ABR9CSS6_9HYPH|nr:adenylate/guanylate cyclase domain-containing protein [Roseibium litorale]
MRGLLKFVRGKRMLVALVAVLTLMAATFIRVTDPPFLTAVRELTFDSYQQLFPREYHPGPVRIVDIDEASLKKYGQWPWPRTRLAELTHALNEMGAAVIAYDIVFAEPDRTSPGLVLQNLSADNLSDLESFKSELAKLPDHDVVFAQSLEESPSVVAFAVLTHAGGRLPISRSGFAFGGENPASFLAPFASTLPSLDMFQTAASGSGGISLSEDEKGGVVRRAPLIFTDGTKLYPSLGVEALRVAQGASGVLVKSTGASGEAATGNSAVTELKIGSFVVPTTAKGEVWVHYDTDRKDRYVPVIDVLDKTKRDLITPLIEGQIVFVGTSAAGLLDLRTTPLGEVVPGVSVHAQMIEQILSEDFLTRPDWADGAEALATLAIGLIVILALPAVGSIGTAVMGAVIAASLVGGSLMAYLKNGLLFDPVFPSLAVLFVFVAETTLLYIMTEREKRFVRQAFGQYLSPHLVNQLEEAPEQLVLGGEMRDMTILFMDVRGFTPISEQLTPTELVSFLNTLLSPLSDIIQHEEGTIDKYIGDSIMAFWNAPLAIKAHASHACRAALDMLKKVDELNESDAFGFKARGLKTQSVHIGIGLNTGEACVGNMGSSRRFNYSVIGDAVNISSRIESSCKAVGAELLISDATRRAAPEFAYLEAGEIPLKGKSEPVRLFALVGDESYRHTEGFRLLSKAHAAMVSAMRDGNAAEAALHLEACRKAATGRQSPFYEVFAAAIAELAEHQMLSGSVPEEGYLPLGAAEQEPATPMIDQT